MVLVVMRVMQCCQKPGGDVVFVGSVVSASGYGSGITITDADEYCRR